MKTTKFKTTVVDDGQKEKAAAKRTATERFSRASYVSTASQRTPYQRMMLQIEKILDTRNQLAVYEKVNNQLVNVTPKLLEVPPEWEERLTEFLKRDSVTQSRFPDATSFKSFTSSVFRQKAYKAIGLQLSIEEVIEGIGHDRIELEDFYAWDSTISAKKTEVSPTSKWRKPFVRITMRKTELVLLYEQRSITALKGTEEGKSVLMDNREYDHLTVGKGKIRRRSESIAQTRAVLYKTRDVNTEKLKTSEKSSFVSYYEMFDTFKSLNDFDHEDQSKKLHFSKQKAPAEQLAFIGRMPSFRLANMFVKRFLASNTYEKEQRRFRHMNKISRMVGNKNGFEYSVKTLFGICPDSEDGERKAVSDMSFCYTNGDILAVAYGIYSYQAAKLPSSGRVCIWSIKNPCDPERFYDYSVPVVAVEFSPFMPSLMAVGLFDGSVEVRDITHFNQPPVAVSKRAAHLGTDPILDLKWIKEATSSDEVDPFLALSQDGSVTQHRVIKSPYLASLKIMSLHRLEGSPEGLPSMVPTKETIHANRTPLGLSLIKHPTQCDVYYVLTDEGCLYKCSTNYQTHYIEALRTHEGAVNYMDFSPWSPVLFLTCGNDWCIRVWMSGILEPLVTLKNTCQPYNWAAWSRTNSTILIAINRVQCEIWDLGRNVLKPVSTTEFNTSYNTSGIFSLDGYCLLIGKERGQVLVNALDDFPFAPHYQYECLEKAMYKALSSYPDLLMELKSIGYFGYPKTGFIK